LFDYWRIKITHWLQIKRLKVQLSHQSIVGEKKNQIRDESPKAHHVYQI